MDECKEKLVELIKSSDITSEDIQIWQTIIPNIADEFCPDVLAVLTTKKEYLPSITNDVKTKISTIKNGRMEDFGNILKNEDAFLKSLAS